MRNSFTEKVKANLKDHVSRYKTQVASYGDSEKLTRGKWLSVRDDPAEIQRLVMTHGEGKTMEWIKEMRLNDVVGGS